MCLYKQKYIKITWISLTKDRLEAFSDGVIAILITIIAQERPLEPILFR